MPAVGALAAIDVVFLALMGVGLLYITRQLWVPFLVWMLSQIPVVGGWVGQQAGRLINDGFAWVAARIAQLIQPLTDAFTRIVTRTSAWIAGVNFGFNATIDALHHIRFDVLGEIQIRLIGFMTARLAALAGVVASQIAAVAARLAWLQAATAVAIEQGFGRAVNLAEQLNGRLRDWVVALLASTLAYLEQRFAQQLQQSETRVRQAESLAAAEVAQAERLASAQLADLKAYVDGSIAGAEGLAGTLAWEARQYADLANARTLAMALTATGAVAIDLAAIRALECIKACAPLGQLGNELQAIDLGLLLAILLGAATHPQEGAQGLADMLAPGASAAHAELAQLFGG